MGGVHRPVPVQHGVSAGDCGVGQGPGGILGPLGLCISTVGICQGLAYGSYVVTIYVDYVMICTCSTIWEIGDSGIHPWIFNLGNNKNIWKRKCYSRTRWQKKKRKNWGHVGYPSCLRRRADWTYPLTAIGLVFSVTSFVSTTMTLRNRANITGANVFWQ